MYELQDHIIRLRKDAIAENRRNRLIADKRPCRKIRGYRENKRHERMVSDFLSQAFAKSLA